MCRRNIDDQLSGESETILVSIGENTVDPAVAGKAETQGTSLNNRKIKIYHMNPKLEKCLSISVADTLTTACEESKLPFLRRG